MLFVLLLSCLGTLGSAVQNIPLVYTVENTGADCKLPPLPAFEDLPTVEPLTDPFEWSDGSGGISGFKDGHIR